MLFVFFILATVFTIISVFMSSRLESSSISTLRHLLENPAQGIWFQMGESMDMDISMSPMFAVRIIDGNRVQIMSSNGIEVSGEQALQVAQEALSSDQETGILEGYNLRYLVGNDGSTVAFMDMTYENNTRGTTNTITFAVCGLGFIAFFVLSFFLSRWMLRPVSETWEQQSQFLSDASHELKTPLTVILANAKILKKSPEKRVEEQMEWVDNTLAEAGRMKGLVDSLLYLSRMENAAKPDMANVDLSRLVYGSALSLESLAFEKNITFDIEVEESTFVYGDSTQLEQLAGILLDNAVKYAYPESEVGISLTQRYGNALLTVQNQGPVIQPENLSRLFDRFYREDKSRSSQGHGLGLAIAKRIVDEHKGKISVTSSKAAGTAFTINFPLTKHSLPRERV